MSERKQQSKFCYMVALLILHAYQLGYEATFGEAYRDQRSPHWTPTTFHGKRLAIDLNLFKSGRYLSKTEDHLPLGEYWESIGGTWGGRFRRPDGNHYSLGE